MIGREKQPFHTTLQYKGKEVEMPIFSYIAIPHKGAKDRLCAELSGLRYCQVVPADNQEIVVLVTDTPDEQKEKVLQQSLKNVESLQSLSLTFGFDEKE